MFLWHPTCIETFFKHSNGEWYLYSNLHADLWYVSLSYKIIIQAEICAWTRRYILSMLWHASFCLSHIFALSKQQILPSFYHSQWSKGIKKNNFLIDLVSKILAMFTKPNLRYNWHKRKLKDKHQIGIKQKLIKVPTYITAYIPQ